MTTPLLLAGRPMAATNILSITLTGYEYDA